MADDIRIAFNRRSGYKRYHLAMMSIGDCDPQYPVLRYISDRMELNEEQRFWLAFLFSLSYCAPTAFYMLNEFPDYENVDSRRLGVWWAANKHRTLFQTDRAKVKNFDKIVPIFESYRNLMGISQKETWYSIISKTQKSTYNAAFEKMGEIYYFGRFSLFLFLESVHQLTGFPMKPDKLDLKDAESCRNGLCYALGLDAWVGKSLKDAQYKRLQMELEKIEIELAIENPSIPVNIWNIETSLCAFKKLFLAKRYLGYYIDRQQEEIELMQKNVPSGVYWDMLWQYRRAYYNPRYLGELCGWSGPRKSEMTRLVRTGHIGDGSEIFVKFKESAKIHTDRRTYEL